MNSIIFRYDYIKKIFMKVKLKNFILSLTKIQKFSKIINRFLENLENNDFNNRICYEIIKLIKTKKKIIIKKKNSKYKIKYKLKYKLIKTSISNNILKPFLNFFFKFLFRKNFPILVSTYLPKKLEYGYMIRSSSFFLWKNFFDINNYKINILTEKNNLSLRKDFFEKKNNKSLKSVMINLLNECFPSCFLEDFSFITKYTKKKLSTKKLIMYLPQMNLP